MASITEIKRFAKEVERSPTNQMFYYVGGMACFDPVADVSFDLHRDDGPAVIIDGGDKLWWYNNGIQHREDGPAFMYVSKQEENWYFEGKRHRIDGPAIVQQNHREWWVVGFRIDQCTFEVITKTESEELLGYYLTSCSPAERYLAEHRSKELNAARAA